MHNCTLQSTNTKHTDDAVSVYTLAGNPSFGNLQFENSQFCFWCSQWTIQNNNFNKFANIIIIHKLSISVE